jgi:hypothetical protein
MKMNTRKPTVLVHVSRAACKVNAFLLPLTNDDEMSCFALFLSLKAGQDLYHRRALTDFATLWWSTIAAQEGGQKKIQSLCFRIEVEYTTLSVNLRT